MRSCDLEFKKTASHCTFHDRGRVCCTHPCSKRGALVMHLPLQNRSSTARGVKINCDNQGVTMLLKDNKFNARTKHINI